MLVASMLTLSTITITACSNSNSTMSINQSVVEYAGQKMTIGDVYQLAVNQNLVQQPVHDIVIADAFAKLYGKKVTKAQVEDQFNEFKSQYKSKEEFESALSRAGLDEKSYKKQLRSTIAYQIGLEELLEIKDDNLKEIYGSYTPESSVMLAVFEKENHAHEFLNSIKNGTDFASKAIESKAVYSSTNDNPYKFDSSNSGFSLGVLSKVYELKENEVSDVLIQEGSDIYGVKQYLVIKMLKVPNKDKNWKTYKDRLTEIYKESQLSDETVVDKLERRALQKVNFKVKDDNFKLIFANELNAK